MARHRWDTTFEDWHRRFRSTWCYKNLSLWVSPRWADVYIGKCVFVLLRNDSRCYRFRHGIRACTRKYASMKEKRNICRSFRNYVIPMVILFSFDNTQELRAVRSQRGTMNDWESWNTIRRMERNAHTIQKCDEFESPEKF